MLVPIDEVVYFDVVTHNPTTGGIADADSTPTFEVYEEATDTGLLGATNFTKRTSLTGNYRGTFTASAANGFEAGKWYSVIASATVSSTVAKKVCLGFMAGPAVSVAGVLKSDVGYFGGTAGTFASGRPEVNTTHIAGTASLSATPGSVRADQVSGAVGSVTAAVALTVSERNSVASALLDLVDGIETNVTLRKGLRGMLASAVGKLTGAATSTVAIRDTNDTKDRITATVDGSGNRLVITLDLT